MRSRRQKSAKWRDAAARSGAHITGGLGGALSALSAQQATAQEATAQQEAEWREPRDWVRSRTAPDEDDDMEDDQRERELAQKRAQAQEKANMEEQDAAAARVQASIRGRQARNDVKEHKEQQVAATKVQASIRGRQARSNAKPKGGEAA